MNKEAQKEYQKAYYESHREEKKAYYQAHKEEVKAYQKAHKQQRNASMKVWKEVNKEKYNAYRTAYATKYYKSELNSLGQTKASIRNKSRYILKKMHLKIPGYQIHHCFTYNDPSKFIYCSKETHLKIHQYLRDNNIDADSNHYEQIKHLLDENVVVFGV